MNEIKRPSVVGIITVAAPIVTPLAPATFFGHSAYMALLEATTSYWLAVIAGIATAAGLEMVGILAGHTAIEFWRYNDRRALLAALLLVAYITIGTVELWRVPIGRAVFLIAGLSYVVVGLRGDAAQVSARTNMERAEDRRNKHELALLQKQYQHEEKIAIIQTQTAAQNSQTAIAAAQNSQTAAQKPQYVCACGREFAVAQSYSAHRRHCSVTVSANGHAV